MKAQLIPFIFLILLIGGVLLGYIFYNTFYGTKYEESVYERNILDIIRNEMEGLKGYSKQALIYSRECLEKYTLYYLNVYFGNYSILELPVQLTKKNFSSCEYQVDPDEVLNPPSVYDPYYDEGNFWVNVSGAMAAISGKSAAMAANISTNEYITRNRFWYLWRIFYEWAQDDIYSPCVCSRIGCACSSGSGEEACTSCKDDSEYCADKALNDLQRRFNESEVKCYRTDPYVCCAQGIGPISCVPKNICFSWQNSLCISTCKHECKPPPPVGPLCPVTSLSPTATYYKYYKDDISSNISLPKAICQRHNNSNRSLEIDYVYDSYNSNSCPAWIEARFATSHEFTCIDNKYHVPSEKGPVPLIFRVRAIAFWRAPDFCPTTSPLCCP